MKAIELMAFMLTISMVLVLSASNTAKSRKRTDRARRAVIVGLDLERERPSYPVRAGKNPNGQPNVKVHC